MATQGAVATTSSTARPGGQTTKSLQEQLAAIYAEKAGRTPAQRKIDSGLLYVEKTARKAAFPKHFPKLRTGITVDPSGQVLVDVSATMSVDVLRAVQGAGGQLDLAASSEHLLRVRMPLTELETLAASPQVHHIGPPAGKELAAGTVTAESDVTHRADLARSTFGVDGTGVKVGVLSDGVKSLAASQASADLGSVTVLPGQAGPADGDEGTAMLEIIHDLAPGAQLYFATAFTSEPQFATNIRALRSAGCKIIVDDVSYFDESPFQDGPVAQAVNDVTASGALYFSSAGNSGNLDDGTSGVWEAYPSALVPGTVGGDSYQLVDFDPGAPTQVQDPIAAGSIARAVTLQWADPYGGSSNDYDLFLVSSDGTSIVDYSNNYQSGSQDPYEQLTAQPGYSNRRVMIGLYSGARRFMHLSLHRGRFDAGTTGLVAFRTAGQTSGHSAAANAFSVAATPARDAFGAGQPSGPYPNPFSSSNVSETFTSDGPRRMFFSPSGTPYTPGNFTATGGIVRNKPDLTAADGVQTSVPGFQPFFGTSAAAPDAAAIVALMLDARASLTNAEIRTIVTTRAIDIEATGWDRDTGYGIVDAYNDVQSALVLPSTVAFQSSTKTVAENAGTVQLTVTRTGNTAVAGSVRYARTGGTATSGPDFTPVSGTLNFAAGQASKTIPLTIVNDTTREGAETIAIILSSPGLYTLLGSPKAMTVTVSPSDQRPDGLISTSSTSGYLGNNIYNTTGSGQTKTVTAKRGGTGTFYVRAYNDGNVTNPVVIRGSAVATGAAVHYYSGTTDITTAMRSTAGYSVNLAAGAYKQITVKITIATATSVGSIRAATVTGSITRDGARADVVKASVTVIG